MIRIFIGIFIIYISYELWSLLHWFIAALLITNGLFLIYKGINNIFNLFSTDYSSDFESRELELTIEISEKEEVNGKY